MKPSKKELRRGMREKLSRLSTEVIDSSSLHIRDLLTFEPGTHIALFAGTAGEPSLLELIDRSGNNVWHLPKITGPGQMEFLETNSVRNLRPGPYGILEPVKGEVAEKLDVIICPGLAFTPEGFRLGQGGGFYDRALARYPAARKIGVAFTCQILPSLPCEEHDIKMDLVITSSEESSTQTLGS